MATSTQNKYQNQINKAYSLVKDADCIVLGIGSGLSAAGGLDYTDAKLAKQWYPQYYAMGLGSIVEIQGVYWFFSQRNAQKYWGFWAQHIYHIRYETEALKPYLDLYELVKDKNYFICTTNCDSQVNKAGFSPDRIFATQGNYCFFQCSKPCTQQVYYNETMIDNMIKHMPNSFEIRTEDIPLCPQCGAPLIPYLRCDDKFVEGPSRNNFQEFKSFIIQGHNKNIVFLELGVGYNTPVIIRYPFEILTNEFPHAHLIRINLTCAEVPKEISDKAVSIQEDLAKVLNDLLMMKRNKPIH